MVKQIERQPTLYGHFKLKSTNCCINFMLQQAEKSDEMQTFGSCDQLLALYPGLLDPAFVACSINFPCISTVSDKHWGEKAWVRG